MHHVGSFFIAYVTFWVALCLLAVGIMLNGIMRKEQKQIASSLHDYVSFLCIRWKLALFLPAFVFVTFAGRFTDDETWDIVTGAGMSLLTYLTAPWSLGLFYKVLKRQLPWRYMIVAIALCLFSASWFYDAYQLLRFGYYTSRWLSNLQLSPIAYVAAGLLWNLEVNQSGGISLSFLRSDWPKPPINQSFRPLSLISLPLIAIAAIVLVAFVRWHI